MLNERPKTKMRTVIDRVKGWFSLSRRTRFLDRRINKLQKEKARSDRELKQAKDQLDKLQEKTEKAFRKMNESVARAEGLNKRLEYALQGAREELEIAQKIIIPGLISANSTFESTWDYDSSRKVMHQVAEEKAE